MNETDRQEIPKVTSEDIINDVIPLHFKTGQSVIIQGQVGVGKSEVIKQATQKLAKELNLTFVDFQEATQEEREALLTADLTKSLLFCEDRLTFKADTSELKGVMLLNSDKGYMHTIPPLMYQILARPKIRAVLLYDEFNQGTGQVIRGTLQIVLEKRVDNLKLSEGVFIIALMNASQDAQDVEELDTPNKNRFRHYRMEANLNLWVKYAITNKCNSRVIAFISAYPDQLNNIIPENSAFPTPRSVFLFGKTLNHIEQGSDNTLYFKRVEREASASCGKAWAIQFCNFLETTQSIDIKAMLKNPQGFNDLEDIGKEYATITGLAETYKQDKTILNDLVRFCTEIDRKEYGGLLINLITEADHTATTKFSLSPNFAKFYEAYKGVFAK